jgi:hypothetical protein
MTTTTNYMPLENQHQLDMGAIITSLEYFKPTGDLKDVYDRFPAEMRTHVKMALFDYREELREGQLTEEEFNKHVARYADIEARQRKRHSEDQALFAGVEELLRSGQIKNPEIQATLQDEIAQGESSLLMAFISMQGLVSPLDAAISYLAWHHTRGLSDLEYEFDVNLDEFQNIPERDFLGVSESQMGICNFSVLSDTRLLPISWTGN